MSGAASIAAVGLAVVFAWAAVAKAVRHRSTVDAFVALGLPAASALAVAVPAVEVGLAGLLVVRPEVGGALALALLAAFTLVVIRGVMRGTSSGCGCFGARRVEPVGPADVVRNGLLAGLAALATGTRTLVRPSPASVAVMLASGGAGLAIQAGARRRLGEPSPSGRRVDAAARVAPESAPGAGSGPRRAGA